MTGDDTYVQYSAIIDRSPLRWPDGARIALWIVPNIELYEYLPPRTNYVDQWPRVPHPDVMNFAYRDYGNRVGFWRMLEILDHYDVRITASLNARVLAELPEIRDAMVARNWEYMSHGLYNTRFLFGMDAAAERSFYREVAALVRRFTGQTVKGMLGPSFSATAATPSLMAEAGLIYSADWFIDDQPFPIAVPTGQLVGIPYSRLLNDHFVLSFADAGSDADYLVQICRDQFDVLYAEGADSGRVMCLALHPFLIGQPHRVRYLDEILGYITGHDGVWSATGGEIAEWYLSECYGAHTSATVTEP